ncbi:MAG: TonB-dependent receptor [Flaviaesturariibacter sp.]|nr:TonB-dependent receptor [Flaviaesturariibacter sp.]
MTVFNLYIEKPRISSAGLFIFFVMNKMVKEKLHWSKFPFRRTGGNLYLRLQFKGMFPSTKTFLSTAALLFASVVFAQNTELELNPVTVTSTLQPTAVSKTGRNIVVIKGEQFSKLAVNSVDELLRYVPGVEVQSRGPMGSQSDIVMRGGTFQQVLVIVDGLRLNDPLSGHFSGYFPIAPAEIERIEVLKGASSAIYGSEAVGGVVHIITKAFAAKHGVKQQSADASVAAGEYGLWRANVGGFYNDGTTAFSGSLLTNNTDGQPARGINNYFHLTTGSIAVSHYINPSLHVAVRSGYDDRNFSAQNFYTTFATDTATERVKSNWNSLTVAYTKAKDRFSIDAGYKTTDDKYAFNTRTTANQNKSKLWQLLLRNDHAFSKGLSLNTGLQYINRGIHSNDRGDHNENQLAGFAVLNYTPASGLTLAPALRLDWNEQREAQVVSQLSVGYSLQKLQLRGSLGNTIRDADFTERYNNYRKPLVTSGRIGNPDLTAETAFTYEVGADYFGLKGFKLSGTFFQRFHQELIDYVNTPYAAMPRKDNLVPTGTYALARNIASVDITGAEIDLQYTQRLNEKNTLQGGIGATWAQAKSGEGAVANAIYLSSFANLLTNFNITFSTPRFTIGVNGLYKERKRQEATAIKAMLSSDYFVLNAKMQVNICKRLSAFVQADNVLDAAYSDLLGAVMPGRWLQGGLSVKL